MKKFFFLSLLTLYFAIAANAQVLRGAVQKVNTDPAGQVCTSNSPNLNYSGDNYTCSDGIYVVGAAKRKQYAIASLPTCNAASLNRQVDVTDGNRAPRTCRNTDGSNYRWIDEDGGRFNITRFGGDPAAGATGSDDTAMAAVITAATATGGEVYIPAGSWEVNTPSATTITNKGNFAIRGAGKTVSIIVAGAGYAGVPVFKLINCRDSIISNLWIQGTPGSVPVGVINSRVENPRNIASIGLTFEHLIIGSNTANNVGDGIRFDHDTTPGACGGSTCDQNNEQHIIRDVEVRNSTGAWLYIDGHNSTWHKIYGGYANSTVDGVKTGTTGGGFTAHGLRFNTLTGNEFKFLGPTQSSSISSCIDCFSENTTTPIIYTSTSPIRFKLDGYSRSTGVLNGSMMEWNSLLGDLWIQNSYFNSGTTGTPLNFNGSGYVYLSHNHALPGTTPTNNGTHIIRAGGNQWEDGTIDAIFTGLTSTTVPYVTSTGTLSAGGLTRETTSGFSFSPTFRVSGAAPGFRASATGGSNLEFGSDVNRSYITTTTNTPIRVYINNSQTAEFQTTGVVVTGEVTASTNLTAINGNVIAGTAGKSIQIKTGSNACSGSSVLVGGTVTVSTTCTPATLGTNGIILLTSQVDGGTPGSLRVSASVASTSFTITSNSASDTSTVGWFIVKQN